MSPPHPKSTWSAERFDRELEQALYELPEVCRSSRLACLQTLENTRDLTDVASGAHAAYHVGIMLAALQIFQERDLRRDLLLGGSIR